jgi:hypothetical protein
MSSAASLKRCTRCASKVTKHAEISSASAYLMGLPMIRSVNGNIYLTKAWYVVELAQMLTLGGDAELELVDSLDPFSEVCWKACLQLPCTERVEASLNFFAFFVQMSPQRNMSCLRHVLDQKSSQGIVFSVRPPKKSWKNISNLSGGEKTLSRCVAVVFSCTVYFLLSLPATNHRNLVVEEEPQSNSSSTLA